MPKLTMLTEMMSPDLEEAIRLLKVVKISLLDLKGGIFGRSIEDLDSERRDRLAQTLTRTGTRAYCFSSVLGHWNVSTMKETEFRKKMEDGVSNLLETIRTVRPELVRLLGCAFNEREKWENANGYLLAHAPWVYQAYADAIERLLEAKVRVTIENEPHCLLSGPEEVLEFFDRTWEDENVGFTWDVQNMWQSGVFPNELVYAELLPLINYIHLKGGRASAEDPEVMAWRSPLEDADWPVREIVEAVLEDGCSPVICLNCSHGPAPEGYRLAHLMGTPELVREEARLDVEFLRKMFPKGIK